MKKLFVVCALAALLTPAYAGIDEGIDKGMTHLSIFGGMAVPVSEYDLGGETLDMGDAGVAYGAQIMHYLTPVFGLGLEVNGANTGDAKYTISGLGISQTTKTSYERYAFMLAGKINFAPAAKTRLYLPFGAGMNHFKATVKQSGTISNGENSESMTKPAFYAGLGVETDLNDIFILGFEARYTGFWLDKDKFGDENDYGDEIGLLLKIGIKF